MAYLDDFHLQEIFLRLPAKSLNRFKCVSKQWLSLISDTCFVHEYEQFQSRRTKNYVYKNLYRTTFIYANSKARTPSCLDFPTKVFDQYEGLSFKFIPRHLQERTKGIEVLAASHGWILCSYQISISSSRMSRWVNDYYLCSPLLKQWIDIPRPPEPKDKDCHLVGFMCEEGLNSSCSSNSNIRLPGKLALQFKVVKIFSCVNVLIVMVFSSENWEWRTSTITCKPSVSSYRICWNPYVVSCDGSLYWIERKTCVFALDLDADGNPLHLHHIPLPTESVSVRYGGDQLGICQGQIHLCCWDKVEDSPHKTIISIWNLSKEVHTDDRHHYQWILKRISHFSFFDIGMVDFAPLDEDLVYITLITNQTMVFNLKNNTMVRTTKFKYDPAICNKVPFVLPYWPLPLKTPKLQLSKKRTGGIRIKSMEPKQKKLILSGIAQIN